MRLPPLPPRVAGRYAHACIQAAVARTQAAVHMHPGCSTHGPQGTPSCGSHPPRRLAAVRGGSPPPPLPTRACSHIHATCTCTCACSWRRVSCNATWPGRSPGRKPGCSPHCSPQCNPQCNARCNTVQQHAPVPLDRAPLRRRRAVARAREALLVLLASAHERGRAARVGRAAPARRGARERRRRRRRRPVHYDANGDAHLAARRRAEPLVLAGASGRGGGGGGGSGLLSGGPQEVGPGIHRVAAWVHACMRPQPTNAWGCRGRHVGLQCVAD